MWTYLFWDYKSTSYRYGGQGRPLRMCLGVNHSRSRPQGQVVGRGRKHFWEAGKRRLEHQVPGALFRWGPPGCRSELESQSYPPTQGARALGHLDTNSGKSLVRGAPEGLPPHRWAWRLLEDRESLQQRMEGVFKHGNHEMPVSHQLWLFQEVTFEEPPVGCDRVSL